MNEAPLIPPDAIESLLTLLAVALREDALRSPSGQSSVQQDLEAYGRLLLEVPLDKDPATDPSQLVAASRLALDLVQRALDLSRDPLLEVLHHELRTQRAMRG